MTTAATGKFDYVVVGAGSAGCALAARLSEDPACRVALLEAGGRDRDPAIHIPAGIVNLIGKCLREGVAVVRDDERVAQMGGEGACARPARPAGASASRARASSAST